MRRAAAALLAARAASATTPCPPVGPAEPRVFPADGAAAPRNTLVRVQQGWSKPVVLDNLRLFNNDVPVDATVESRGFEGDLWRVLRPSILLSPGPAEVRAPPETLAHFEVIAAEDTSAPTFGGVTGVEALGAEGCKPARLRFKLGAMSDDVTPPQRLVVHFYLASASGRQEFSKPVMVPAAEPELHAFNAPIRPGQRFYVVAGLVDEAGNESSPRSEEWKVDFAGGGCGCGGGAPASALPVLLFGLLLIPSRGTSRGSCAGR